MAVFDVKDRLMEPGVEYIQSMVDLNFVSAEESECVVEESVVSLYFVQQVNFVLRFAFAVPVIKFDFPHELLYSHSHLIQRLSAGSETYLAFHTHSTFLI